MVKKKQQLKTWMRNNLAFYIDDKRTNDSPFKLMGPEVGLE
jgi:hypothetical protein